MIRVLPDLWDLRDPLVRRGQRAQLVRLALPARPVQLDRKDLLVHKDQRVTPAPLARLERSGLVVQLDPSDQSALKGQRVTLARWELLGLWALPGLPDPLDRAGHRELKAQPGIPVLQG